MPKLLVVDDEPSILLAFQRAFRAGDMEVLTAETGSEGLARARESRPDVAILDVQLPDQSGLDLFRSLHELDARCPVIFVTGKSTTETAIEAMKLGAYEYLLKPLELAQLRQVIERALAISRLMHVPAVMVGDEPVERDGDPIIGRCAAMQEVYKAIGRVAAQEVTVLIQGESGTGKELVARALYQHSRRASGPFLAVNCAALPEQLLDSELFGHEKGAFTGAERRRIGKFEQCSGGTLFLDEVAELSPLAQGKMLRVLQGQPFERLGGSESIQTNVRILAATNQDLASRVRQGRFREDLFYRLGEFTIALPPLRERGDDLRMLVQHYLRRFAGEFGKPVMGIAPETMTRLQEYSWPGNVRELQSVLKQALLQATGEVLLPEFLPGSVTHKNERQAGADPGVNSGPLASGGPAAPLLQFIEDRLRAGSENLYEEALHRTERVLLTRVLQHTGGNQLQAAKILGITRGSLRTKIRELGIAITRTVADEGTAEE
jgi:two-component system nitrogen regulation response regulator GlnG